MLVLLSLACYHTTPLPPPAAPEVVAAARGGLAPTASDHLSAYLSTCGQPWSAHAFSPCKRTRDGWVCWGAYNTDAPPVRIHEGPAPWWATSGAWGVRGARDAATLPALWAVLAAQGEPCVGGKGAR